MVALHQREENGHVGTVREVKHPGNYSEFIVMRITSDDNRVML